MAGTKESRDIRGRGRGRERERERERKRGQKNRDKRFEPREWPELHTCVHTPRIDYIYFVCMRVCARARARACMHGPPAPIALCSKGYPPGKDESISISLSPREASHGQVKMSQLGGSSSSRVLLLLFPASPRTIFLLPSRDVGRRSAARRETHGHELWRLGSGGTWRWIDPRCH